MNSCKHNKITRYTSGFHCEECNIFFEKESPTYRSRELLTSIYMVLNNINVDSRRAGKGDIKEVLLMKDKIGIGIYHKNYEELITEAEIIMSKYNENSDSASLILE